MSRVGYLLSVLLLLFAVVAPVATAEDEAPPTVAPTSLDELKDVLGGLAQRLGRLIEIAEKDPRHEIVDRYVAQMEEDFKSRGRVKAKELVEIMENEEASPDVRVRAKDALASNTAKTFDPDLLVEKGQTKPRNRFCLQQLVPLLKKDDPQTRTLAQQLLLLYFREGQRDPSIGMFKPQSATKGERDRAKKAWIRFLRK